MRKPCIVHRLPGDSWVGGVAVHAAAAAASAAAAAAAAAASSYVCLYGVASRGMHGSEEYLLLH